MKPDSRQLEHFRRAREALDHAPPLSPAEQAAFASQCAQKDHEAWLRRHPEAAGQQLPFPEVA